MNNQQKVRTMFSYGKPGQPEWGTDVSEDAVTMVNTKLELGPRETRLDELESTLHLLRGAGGLTFENIRKCGPEPAFTPNSPTQIVTDYLTKIRESACRQKNIDLEQLARTKTPVDLVITVPVVRCLWRRHPPFQLVANLTTAELAISSKRCHLQSLQRCWI